MCQIECALARLETAGMAETLLRSFLLTESDELPDLQCNDKV